DSLGHRGRAGLRAAGGFGGRRPRRADEGRQQRDEGQSREKGQGGDQRQVRNEGRDSEGQSCGQEQGGGDEDKDTAGQEFRRFGYHRASAADGRTRHREGGGYGRPQRQDGASRRSAEFDQRSGRAQARGMGDPAQRRDRQHELQPLHVVRGGKSKLAGGRHAAPPRRGAAVDGSPRPRLRARILQRQNSGLPV